MLLIDAVCRHAGQNGLVCEQPSPSRVIQVQGHRGARGLVSESTLEGFLLAAQLGCAAVELDAVTTADGKIVVWHDHVLEETKVRGPGLVGRRIEDCTWEELSAADIGSMPDHDHPHQRLVPGARLLTLRDLLVTVGAAAPALRFIVELKVDATRAGAAAYRERLLAGVLTDVDAAGVRARAVLHSFDWHVLQLAREVAPDLQRSALATPGDTFRSGSPWLPHRLFERVDGDLVAAAADVGAQVVCPFHGGAPTASYDVVDAGFVGRAHDQGITVVPWTVNDPNEVLALARCEVDGIITDYPDRVLDVLAVAMTRDASAPEARIEQGEQPAAEGHHRRGNTLSPPARRLAT